MKKTSKKPSGKGMPAKAPNPGDDVQAKSGKGLPAFMMKGKKKK